MIAVVFTQVFENYGTAEQPFWKAKGGEEIKITDLSANPDLELIRELADIAFSEDSDMYREYVVDVSIEANDYLSTFEKSQLEYDGTIAYPEKTVRYCNLMTKYHIEQQSQEFEDF